MNDNIVEWTGYAAMAILIISFLMKDIKKLRIINTIACLLFVIYGYMLHSYPIMISNAFIGMVNLYYLYQKNVDNQ